MPQQIYKQARYIDKIITEGYWGLITIITYRVLPNTLTPLYLKNYYKEENYLTVGTVSLNT